MINPKEQSKLIGEAMDLLRRLRALGIQSYVIEDADTFSFTLYVSGGPKSHAIALTDNDGVEEELKAVEKQLRLLVESRAVASGQKAEIEEHLGDELKSLLLYTYNCGFNSGLSDMNNLIDAKHDTRFMSQVEEILWRKGV